MVQGLSNSIRGQAKGFQRQRRESGYITEREIKTAWETGRKDRMNGKVQFVIKNVWLCCETLKDCHSPLSTETIYIPVRGNLHVVQGEQLQFQIAFECQWRMLLSQAWIYWEQQEGVITSRAELDESLQLVLLSCYMATEGPFTFLRGCQRVNLAWKRTLNAK